MKKIVNLGVIGTLNQSGILVTDLGYKMVSAKAKAGDILLEIEGEKTIVTKKEFAEKYRTEVNKYEKHLVTLQEEKDAENQNGLEVVIQQKDEALEEVKNLKVELKAARVEIAKMISEKEQKEADEAKRVLDAMGEAKEVKK